MRGTRLPRGTLRQRILATIMSFLIDSRKGWSSSTTAINVAVGIAFNLFGLGVGRSNASPRLTPTSAKVGHNAMAAP